uniref:Uncharacterized protein n=1 Tax=Ficedula albicollis TaxID=59894 RepID=A0A803VE19_FICAL
MLPIGLNMCSPADQELIALAKGRYALKDTDEEVREFLHNNLHLQDKVENTGSARWQMALGLSQCHLCHLSLSPGGEHGQCPLADGPGAVTVSPVSPVPVPRWRTRAVPAGRWPWGCHSVTCVTCPCPQVENTGSARWQMALGLSQCHLCHLSLSPGGEHGQCPLADGPGAVTVSPVSPVPVPRWRTRAVPAGRWPWGCHSVTCVTCPCPQVENTGSARWQMALGLSQCHLCHLSLSPGGEHGQCPLADGPGAVTVSPVSPVPVPRWRTRAVPAGRWPWGCHSVTCVTCPCPQVENTGSARWQMALGLSQCHLCHLSLSPGGEHGQCPLADGPGAVTVSPVSPVPVPRWRTRAVPAGRWPWGCHSVTCVTCPCPQVENTGSARWQMALGLSQCHLCHLSLSPGGEHGQCPLADGPGAVTVSPVSPVPVPRWRTRAVPAGRWPWGCHSVTCVTCPCPQVENTGSARWQMALGLSQCHLCHLSLSPGGEHGQCPLADGPGAVTVSPVSPVPVPRWRTRAVPAGRWPWGCHSVTCVTCPCPQVENTGSARWQMALGLSQCHLCHLSLSPGGEHGQCPLADGPGAVTVSPVSPVPVPRWRTRAVPAGRWPWGCHSVTCVTCPCPQVENTGSARWQMALGLSQCHLCHLSLSPGGEHGQCPLADGPGAVTVSPVSPVPVPRWRTRAVPAGRWPWGCHSVTCVTCPCPQVENTGSARWQMALGLSQCHLCHLSLSPGGEHGQCPLADGPGAVTVSPVSPVPVPRWRTRAVPAGGVQVCPGGIWGSQIVFEGTRGRFRCAQVTPRCAQVSTRCAQEGFAGAQVGFRCDQVGFGGAQVGFEDAQVGFRCAQVGFGGPR